MRSASTETISSRANELAKAIGKSKTTVRRWEAEGKLKPTVNERGVRLYRVIEHAREELLVERLFDPRFCLAGQVALDEAALETAKKSQLRGGLGALRTSTILEKPERAQVDGRCGPPTARERDATARAPPVRRRRLRRSSEWRGSTDAEGRRGGHPRAH